MYLIVSVKGKIADQNIKLYFDTINKRCENCSFNLLDTSTERIIKDVTDLEQFGEENILNIRKMTINTGRILINSTLSMWKFMSIIDDNDFKVCEIGDETRNIITPAKSIYFSGKCEKVIHTELWHYSTGEVLVEVRTNTFSQLDNYKIFWGYEDYNGYLDLLDFYRYAIFPHYEQIKHFNVDFIYIKLKNKICPIYKVAVRDDIMDFVKKYSTKSNILRG